MHILRIEYTQPTQDEYELSCRTEKVTEWLVNYDVYGCQCAPDKIAFDTDKMRNLAILWLCDEKQIKRLKLG